MGKTRVYELAKRLDVPSKRIIDLLADIGFEVKNHMSVVDEEAVKRITYQLTGKGEAPATQPPAQAQKQKENKPQPPKKDGGKAPKAAEAKKAQGAGAQKDQPRKKRKTNHRPSRRPSRSNNADPKAQRPAKAPAIRNRNSNAGGKNGLIKGSARQGVKPVFCPNRKDRNGLWF